MQLKYTPYVLPFVVSLLLTVLLGIYAFRQQKIPVARTFAWVMTALSIWTFCYGMELLSITLNGKLFWDSVKYLGSAPGPILFFVLSLQLTKKESWLNKYVLSGLYGFIGITCLIVFTNKFHHWYWTKITVEPGFLETQTVHGFYFWIYAAVTYVLILTSLILYFQYYQAMSGFFRRQAFWMALGGFIPLAGRIPEDFLGIDLIPKVDNVVILFLLSSSFFALAIFRFDAFNILPIAHNLIVQNIGAGIIVLDLLGHVIDLNQFAAETLNLDQKKAIRKSLKEILTNWTDLDLRVGQEQEIEVWENGQKAYYLLHYSEIKESNATLVGYVLVFFNITARKVAEYQLKIEQEKAERLLLNILPNQIATRLKEEQYPIADEFPEVTVLFADIVDFTSLSSMLTPEALVTWLNDLFSAFDKLTEKHGLEKIKTIGDAYMVVSGVPNPRPDHAEVIAKMALDIQAELAHRADPVGKPIKVRIGINTGSVIAGVIGEKKFSYDLWGDTVNTASRMESHGLADGIQVTEETYKRLAGQFKFEERGSIPIKGKGTLRTYLLTGRIS